MLTFFFDARIKNENRGLIVNILAKKMMDYMKKITFRQQLQRNAVALISLTVAISSFAYNSWRNELTEQNHLKSC